MQLSADLTIFISPEMVASKGIKLIT